MLSKKPAKAQQCILDVMKNETTISMFAAPLDRLAARKKEVATKTEEEKEKLRQVCINT